MCNKMLKYAENAGINAVTAIVLHCNSQGQNNCLAVHNPIIVTSL